MSAAESFTSSRIIIRSSVGRSERVARRGDASSCGIFNIWGTEDMVAVVLEVVVVDND